MDRDNETREDWLGWRGHGWRHGGHGVGPYGGWAGYGPYNYAYPYDRKPDVYIVNQTPKDFRAEAPVYPTTKPKHEDILLMILVGVLILIFLIILIKLIK